MFKRFIFEEEGQTAVEYMLLVSLLVLFLIKMVGFLVDSFGAGLITLRDTIEALLETGRGFK